MLRTPVVLGAVSALALAACTPPPAGPETPPAPSVPPPAPGSMSGNAPTTVNPLPDAQGPPQAETPPNKPPPPK